MIIALARPQSSTNWEESTTEGIDIVLTMDISGSMLAQDLKPDRLEASKNVAMDFISKRKMTELVWLFLQEKVLLNAR